VTAGSMFHLVAEDVEQILEIIAKLEKVADINPFQLLGK
jgi:hypothetical protein